MIKLVFNPSGGGLVGAIKATYGKTSRTSLLYSDGRKLSGIIEIEEDDDIQQKQSSKGVHRIQRL